VRGIRALVVVGCSIVCLLVGRAYSQQPDVFESLLASAQQAQARGDFEAAAEFYRKAVGVRPEIAELQANLGLMYYQTGKDQKAIGAFQRAIRLKPRLFVPNLFLGLEYVKFKRFTEAISYLKKAALTKSADVQVQLALGEAYAGSGKTRLASASFSRATQLDPKSADAWYHLGVSYLEQVEADARILLTKQKDSAYVQLLMAETFAEQRAFVQAEEAYKKVLAFSKVPTGAHAGYGFVLLNRHDFSGAERELRAEIVLNPGSLIAKLGMARLHLEQGATQQAVKEIREIAETDAGFLRANASLFNAGLPRAKRAELRLALEEGQVSGDLTKESVALFRDSVSSTIPEATPDADGSPLRSTKIPGGDPIKLYASGNYEECNDVLGSGLQQLPAKDLQLLASCAYLTGKYPNALKAAATLASNALTEAEGLYWETKSAQKLATHALARASAADPGSPKLHVLLGDIYRQQKAFPDAEQEYRKALVLRPEDTGALFGLSLALLADGQNDEALSVAQASLEKNPDDPELNAVMGEILCVRNDFSAAEPYLKKSLNTKPEFVSHVHALLGKVYAHTNRTKQAIAELKLGLASDKDGGLHYQIARLYLKVGDRDSAKQAFDASKRLQQQGLMRAAVAIEQGEYNSEPQ
jgi:tetratricopeptide (TPR) repeat protein